jgi:transposase
VIVTSPERLREELRGLTTGGLLESCSRLRRSSSASADELATRLVLRSLARRIEAATREADQLERELLGHVRALAPTLLDEPGVGPIVAAQLIVAWSRRGRLRSEACFARLAGVAAKPGDNTCRFAGTLWRATRPELGTSGVTGRELGHEPICCV